MNNYNLVLLHGYKQNSKHLAALEKRLSPYFKTFNLNLLKFNSINVISFDDYINDLENKISSLNNLIIIGYSLGGKLASFYALNHNVKALILIAPSTYIKTKFKTKIKILIAKFSKIFKIKHKHLASKSYKELNAIDKRSFKNLLVYLHKKDLKKIKIPVLIIGFKKDENIATQDLKYLHKHLINSELILYKGKHDSLYYHLNEIGENIYDFIASL